MPGSSLRRSGRRAARVLWVAALAGLCGCAPLAVTEDTPAAVTVRYDGVNKSLDDATVVANQYCGAHGRTAQLRKVDQTAALQHFAHFDCVGG